MKELVYAKGKTAFGGIVAKDLVLWKVSDIRVYLQHLLSRS